MCQKYLVVLQGSVTGPLFFNLFVNDLLDNINTDIALYANDAKLFKPIKCLNDIQELQTDLNKIADWMRTGEMEVNTNKSSYLCLGPKNFKSTYSFETSLIPKTSLEWDLGVIID